MPAKFLTLIFIADLKGVFLTFSDVTHICRIGEGFLLCILFPENPPPCKDEGRFVGQCNDRGCKAFVIHQR